MSARSGSVIPWVSANGVICQEAKTSPFTGRGCANHSNYKNRPATAVQSSSWLRRSGAAVRFHLR